MRHFALAALAALIASTAPAQDTDRIFTGGPVLTMNDAQPRADAVAVKDGRIVAVGGVNEIMALRGADTVVSDLAGRALLPGFVDGHVHIFGGGVQAMAANLLAPPDGAVTDIASLQDTLRAWLAANRATVEGEKLIVGFGYDNSQLAERRHPTRAELDAMSTEHPIYFAHQSGHLGAANSKALAGVPADSENPPGGVIVRDASGEITGVLEENAHHAVLVRLMGSVDRAGVKAIVKAGAELWARYGYTTAAEGLSLRATAEIMKETAAESAFRIDVASHMEVRDQRAYLLANAWRAYVNRFRLGGPKLSIDSSPQRFAALKAMTL